MGLGMDHKSLRGVGASFLLLAAMMVARPALADPSECQDAIDKYNSAVSELRSSLSLYTLCLSDSHGHDDCSIAFVSVQSAQESFESAVTSYRDDCS